MTLLSHYFQPDTDPAVIRASAADWLDILSPFPQGAVGAACRDYLRDEPKVRPTPGAIRALVLKHLEREMAEAAARRAALPPPERPRLAQPERTPATEEQRARILAEFGMTERRMAAILGGRRMPPPNQPGYVEPPPEPPRSAEEAAARPYTADELARMRALRPHAPEEASA